jgi:Chaperone of endosialidase/Carboxypeptidase regulatory-like domain
MKSLQIGLIGFILSVATAWAGPSSIQGVAKDAKGQAIKGADVRIESRDGKKVFQTVKTDGKGRYVSSGLAAGVYRVTLIVNGAVKASIMNTQTRADQATQLNFDLKPASASQASTTGKTGKRKVWVPSSTGSHIGGRWVEVDESGAAEAGALNVKRGSAEALRQEQLRSGGGLPGSASGATSSGSSRRFKKDIEPMDKASEAILALSPVTFHYKSDKTSMSQFGLIAEEVADVNPDLVARDKNGEIYTVRYDAVNAMLLNEFLKEHRKVEEQGAIIAKQQKQIDALTTGLQKVSDQLELSKRAPE